MSSSEQALAADGYGASLLSRDRIVARPGFNRWLVPPAALAIHLCIGMIYGFSVFWLPLSRALGISKPIACPGMTLGDALFTTTCDWRITDLGWVFTLAIVMLGLSAAVWGGWLERAGPRRAGLVAAVCWCGGFLVSALGIYVHQLWLMWVGSGLIGGIGLGLGYISPVSTLVKWFPDRRGMATGLAIMGFGGGAMIGAPLANMLMTSFRTPTSVGVWQTFVVLGAIYFAFMLGGAFGYRVPPGDWQPEGWQAPAGRKMMVTDRYVLLEHAHQTRQFWLIWAVLCLNVSAGIGVINIASPMLQEIFGGSLIGQAGTGLPQLNDAQRAAVAAIAAGFTGLLSLFNIAGRFFWASLSDWLGRKSTYFVFFALGLALYALAPSFAHMGSKALFVLAMCIILSMYGGGFSTVPAYLADIFGVRFVGAIHGRLLTAWSAAGVIGPVLVNYIRQAQIRAHVPLNHVYDFTLYILSALLVLGLVCNALVRPLRDRWFAREEVLESEAEKGLSVKTRSHGIGLGRLDAITTLIWLPIAVPLLWGVWITLRSASVIFR